MRIKYLLAFLLAAIGGCADVADSTSTAASPLGEAPEAALICPTICGENTQCQFPTGVCREACNPCLCVQQGGTVVPKCPAAAPDEATAAGEAQPQVSAVPEQPEQDDAIGGGQCNKAVCGAGEFCCNFSCSTCAALGNKCTDQFCPPTD
jgi:hypothetical protein